MKTSKNYTAIHKCVRQDGRQWNLPALFHHRRAEIHYTSHTTLSALILKNSGRKSLLLYIVVCALCILYRREKIFGANGEVGHV